MASWTCPACEERVDTIYAVCWKCGTRPDGTKDPDFESGLAERDYPPADAALLKHYRCPRCDHDQAEVETVRAATGFLSRILDVETARFQAVTCTRCTYTELFKADKNRLADILELIAG